MKEGGKEMKKLHLLIATLLIFGMVLAACAPAAAPEEPTAPPAVQEEPTEAVAEEPTEPEAEEPTEAVAEEPTEAVAEEPTETEGPAPAAQDKWCAGTKIVFFPGGPPGGPFATVVYNGALAAAADLGPDVEYVWSDWNPERMVTQFAEAAATQPDGIAIMGHPGDDAFSAVVADAE
jgi:ABC-type sugar transport system substrate-binding protein